MNRKLWIIIGLLLIVALEIGGYFVLKSKKSSQVTIDGHMFNVELATTEAQREQGLMNRTHLDADAGMLFVFPKVDIYTFWMKDTKIPLDIIWLAPSEVEGIIRIVEMMTLQPPSDDNIPQYTPKNSANYVLELNAGTAQKDGFKVGDEVEIKL